MKYSIRKQMLVMFVGLILAMLCAILVVNNVFLGEYYVSQKKPNLIAVYEILESKNDDLYNTVTIQRLLDESERANISFGIYDVYENKMKAGFATAHEMNVLENQLKGYLYGKNEGELLDKTDTYEIWKSKDVKSRSSYLEMWGQLSDGNTFIMRTPLESIRESVALSSKFLAYVGIIIIAVGILLVWLFSKKITEPILELAALSERMAEQDFEVKYTSGGENEIGVLGRNFNIMSEKLEETISELKNANYELKQDIEKKEKIEEMRTEFIGNVSHELKTPIALIQGYAEGLKEGVNSDAESRDFYCDVIMDEAGKMNRMVKNLLTLNQLEFGESDVQFDRFNIVELIQGVIQSCEILIQQKDAEVRFDTSTPVYVWADEYKVEQVVRNYFSNALNHLDGKRVIDIKVRKDKKIARISVFNTGKPIPQEDIGRIWDKFYKVDKARTREYGGNGIGLSIVKAIMEAMQKDYGVRNYDNGVEFWFELDVK